MKSAPPPANEEARLAALGRYGVLDTPAEPAFDDLTRLAATLCQTPISLITFIDGTRQWFKSRLGVDVESTPRETSFCGHTILRDELFVVEDAARDERFADNPLVQGSIGVRFYAAAPIITPDGYALGALSVLDRVPRQLTSGQGEALRTLAHQVITHLELRRKLVELARSVEEHSVVEERLRNSEAFFQTLVETLPQNIIRKDLQGRFTFANRKFCEAIRRPIDEILGRTDHDLFPAELAAKYHLDDERVINSQEPLDTVEAHQPAAGDKQFVHVIKTPLFDAAGRVAGVQGIFWDVTQRKRIEEALAHERDLLRALLDHIPDRLYFKDTNGRFIACSRSMAVRLGVEDPQQVVGRTDFDFHPPDMAREFAEDEQRILAHGQPLINKPERQLDKNGREIWASVTKVPIFSRFGTVTGLVGLSRDITQLKQTEQALRQAEEKYRTIYENSVEGIFQTTRDGHFITANPALARLYGYNAPEELVAALTNIEQQLYVNPERREEFARQMRDHGSVSAFESEVYRKDRSKIWISESARTVKDADGNILYYEGIVEDVTARKFAEEERETARRAALESARTKAQFLANMSHEIRTPMNAITGMTGLLLDTRLTQEQREYVETIRGGTEALLDIINDILDFSKLEAGKVAVETLDFDLRDTVESTAEMLAERAHKKDIELVCQIDPGLNTRLRGDSFRVRQVFTNLISNAIKFTDQGEVLVRVRQKEATPEQAIIRAEVHDTGIGIPPEAMPRIFQEFTQADGSTTRKYGGTGLGLTISRQLVEMMRGRIGVETQAGEGSTFWFELPFDVQAPPPPAPSRTDTLREVRALVVENNASQRGVLQDQLRHWGLDVEAAPDATRATEMLQHALHEGRPYAVALVDLEMPETDGLTFAQTLKGDPNLAPTRIIMLTTLLHRLNINVMQATGISACLVKPVRQARLLDALVDVMSASGAVSAAASGPSGDTTITQLATPQDVRVLLAEDNSVNQRVALRQLKKLGFAADAVSNGVEVLSALQRAPYDLILMDCQMPEMDGYEVTQRIRQAGNDSFIHLRAAPYIIALTANALPGDRERCLAAGMNDYLTKPLHLRELEAVLQRALLKIRPAAAPPRAAPPPPDVLDMSVIDGLRDLREPGQSDPLAELIELFFKDARPRLDKMSEAAAAADWPRLAASAHTLKGSASNLGARRLSRLCAALEKQAKANDSPQASATLAEIQSEFETVEQVLQQELRR